MGCNHPLLICMTHNRRCIDGCKPLAPETFCSRTSLLQALPGALSTKRALITFLLRHQAFVWIPAT